MLSRGYRVRGRVQGVGFRWWARSQASRLGLAGTVKNLSDGSVEIQVCGAEAAVDEFHLLLGHGPGGAQVDMVEPIEPVPFSGAGFVILTH